MLNRFSIKFLKGTMKLPEEFSSNSGNSYIDDKEILLKVEKCKEYVFSGQTFTFLENIEETIQLCVEFDLPEDGIFLTEAVLEIAPYNSEIWQLKGILSNNLFRFEDAYDSFTKALSLNPGDVETLINKSIAEDNLGLFDDSVATLEHALVLEPENEEAFFSLGILFEKKELYRQAIEYFRKALEIDPEYGEAWYELGFCFENLNELKEI